MTPELKSLTERYLKLTFWYLVRQDDNTLTVEQFEVVLNEIGRLEDELLACGLKSEQIDWLIKHTRAIADKTLIELPENQQLMMLQAFFGAGANWAEQNDKNKGGYKGGD